ncbi:MAG: hypothetical protein ACOY7U_01225 [Acidobacteriota bacterium]
MPQGGIAGSYHHQHLKARRPELPAHFLVAQGRVALGLWPQGAGKQHHQTLGFFGYRWKRQARRLPIHRRQPQSHQGVIEIVPLVASSVHGKGVQAQKTGPPPGAGPALGFRHRSQKQLGPGGVAEG